MEKYDLKTKEGLKMAVVYLFQYGIVTEKEHFNLLEKVDKSLSK